jgi:predicted transposase YbfD/YdcC
MKQKQEKKQVEKENDLITLLRTLKDYRRKQGRRHSLEVILLIIIMAIMAGAKGERAIARFAQNNKKSLIKALQIERKQVPTRCIIQRTIQNVDFTLLRNIFHQWAIRIIPIQKHDIMSVDGKALKGTVKESQSDLQNFTSLVSVFSSKRRQVLTAEKIETKKESEIPTARDLIEMLNLKDVTFTLDALHCQEKTAKTIKKSGNHFIIGVKENQKKLLENIKKMPKSGISIHQRRKEQGTNRKKNGESV